MRLWLLCAAAALAGARRRGRPPTLQEMASDTIPTLIPSPSGPLPFRDLPAVANFVGSVGVATQGSAANATPFLISSFTVPPFAACGAPGCGRLWVNGREPHVTSTRWRAFEAQRNAPAPDLDGVAVTSRTRMGFEKPVVMWEVDVNTSTADGRPVEVIVEWAGSAIAATAGLGWTMPLPAPLEDGFAVTRGPVLGGATTVLTAPTNASRPVPGGQAAAYSLFVLFDGDSGDNPVWSFPAERGAASGSEDAPTAPLPRASFKLQPTRAGATTIRAAMAVGFNQSHCESLLGSLLGKPGPLYTRESRLKAVHRKTKRWTAARAGLFQRAWSDAADRWEQRWQNAFTPSSDDYSGSLPVLTVAPSDAAEAAVQPLERAYYMGVLTLLLVQRNSLPQPPPPSDGAWPAQPRIYQTGMGSAWGAPSSLTRRKRSASLPSTTFRESQGALHSWGIHRHRTHAALVLGLGPARHDLGAPGP